MNPVDAIRLMVKSYPGGADALAVLVGKSGETLRKEIAGASGYKLGVNDACTISEACIAVKSEHCYAYANAVAVNCGGFVQLEVVDPMAARNLAMDTAGMLRECSNVVSDVTQALSDGAVSDNERKVIERDLTKLIEQLQRVQSDVAAANEQSHVRAVR
jgi:hypothetical protein